MKTYFTIISCLIFTHMHGAEIESKKNAAAPISSDQKKKVLIPQLSKGITKLRKEIVKNELFKEGGLLHHKVKTDELLTLTSLAKPTLQELATDPKTAAYMQRWENAAREIDQLIDELPRAIGHGYDNHEHARAFFTLLFVMFLPDNEHGNIAKTEEMKELATSRQKKDGTAPKSPQRCVIL